MHKIESISMFIEWAHKVNTAPFNKICDLQDVFARSDYSELKHWFVELSPGDRRLVTFAIHKAMDDDCFFALINYYSRCMAEEHIPKLNEMQRQMASMEATIDNLNFQLEEERMMNTDLEIKLSEERRASNELEKIILGQDKLIDDLETFKRVVLNGVKVTN